MLNRNIIHEKFRYKTNDFNFRLGFLEETTVNRQVLFTRIDHWKTVLTKYCGLKPLQTLMIYMNQLSLDTFAIYFAAIECDISLVDADPDLLIHSLADIELENLNLNLFTNYNYFDLADLKFNVSADYEQKGVSKIYGFDQDYILQNIKKQKKYLDIKGNLLHTKYKNKSLVVDFMLPSFAKEIEAHFALGYNDLVLGIDKIAHIVQKCAIDCIILPHADAAYELRNACFKRNVNINDLQIFYYDKGSILQSNKHNEITKDNEYFYVPEKFNIRGSILVDSETLYFKFDYKVEDSVAEIKIKIMNAYLEKKYNKKITKWGSFDALYDLEDSLVIFRNL
jgi:hypothetical protein